MSKRQNPQVRRSHEKSGVFTVLVKSVDLALFSLFSGKFSKFSKFSNLLRNAGRPLLAKGLHDGLNSDSQPGM